MKSVSSTQPVPVYLQLADLLIRQIQAGYWHQGERLPTEAVLAASLNVAVGTLRKALALLAEKDVLERVQGSGTYVKRATGSKRHYELFRLELVTGPGLPTARILDVARMKHPPHVPSLANGTASEVWRVRRMRFLNQTPVALEEIWFSGAHCATLQAEELGDSMYLFYQNRFQTWIARVEDRLSAAPTPPWAQPPLELVPGACAGFVERVSWTASQVLAEFSHTWFDPAACRYASRLSQ
ncbi:MAG: GntR family transcriptional regulator [Burkholderiales bacterium]|nr:GntR family transcriptional regulator [Burkholderiales bacterium]